MESMLYIVATPIGNLKDISHRAVEVLKSVDLIACEDTRHSIVLLNAWEIKKPLISYHKFNEKTAAESIINEVKNGKSVAVITDAGTPCISDPGQILINEAITSGIKYTVIPGACAFINALVLSGFDSSAFMFMGFLPQNNRQRQELLNNLTNTSCTLIFYCAPHDIEKDISSLYKAFGDRKFAAVKEITKIHERVIFGNLSEGLKEDGRGEYVLIVEGAAPAQNPLNSLGIEKHIQYYTDSGMPLMDAVKQTAKDRKIPKNQVYKYTLKDR